MFGRSHLWSHLVLDFCLLGVFILLIQFHYWWLIRSYFLFLPCAVFGDSMFLGIYFLLVVHYIGILWLIIISHISWYFCGISCNLTFFISDFIYVAHLFFFFYCIWLKVVSFLFEEPTLFSIDLFCFFQSLFHSSPLLSLWFLLTFVVPLLSRVQLSAAPWTAVCQASLFFTISWSLLKLLTLVFVSSYFSSSFRYKVGWLIWKCSFLK